jgi:hypothetical protein
VTQTDSGPRSYRFTVVETTLWTNWFFVGSDYSSYTLLRNTTATDIHATLTWRDANGTAVASESVTIAGRAIVYRDARASAAGAIAGSVEVAHDGQREALVGSQTTLSATTGLSFDTIFMQRRGW